MYFQKKLLLVELSWMNEDAQQEARRCLIFVDLHTLIIVLIHQINMFLRATEMNATEMNLGGFFNVNRTLFKSVRSLTKLNKDKILLTSSFSF